MEYESHHNRHGLEVGMRVAWVSEYKDQQTQKWISFEYTGVITDFSTCVVSIKKDSPKDKADTWGEWLYKTGDKQGSLLLTNSTLQCISLAKRDGIPHK